MEQLKGIYEQYIRALEKANREAKATDGLFGMGDDPRKDPCHMRFYEDVQQWVQDLAAGSGEQERSCEAVRFLLETPARYREHPAFWFMFAAQGLAKPLIPRLTKEQCAQLRIFYDDAYPKRERMPVQKDVYKLLKKGAGR